MTDLFASVNGHRVKSMRLFVPNNGPWFADCKLDEAVRLSGKVTATLGALSLAGTVAPDSSGSFVLTSAVRVVAGAGGWGTQLASKSYHNDATVRARTVAADAAREAGEVLDVFQPGGSGALSADYVRRAGPASRALEDAAAGTPWWVDYAGKTQVGPRPGTPLATKDYELLTFDPSSRLVELTVDDPTKLVIGSVITDRVDDPLTVRELEYSMTDRALRATAWCGGDDATTSRLARQLTKIIERILARRLFGKYRYRVVSVAADGRLNLQAVSKAVGLPDILPCMIRPGLAGVWASPALGGEVLVEFIAGAPTDPIVSAFPGRGEAGFIPTKITIGADTPADAPPAARQGDTVRVPFPPAIFSGTIVISGVPSPATGAITFTPSFGVGVIEGGSGHVGIGT